MKKKEIALITGGSSGLGKSLANKFLEYKIDICLIARNENKLEVAKKEFEECNYNSKIFILSGNISDEDFVNRIYNFLFRGNYYPKYLINCAGVGEFGNVQKTSKKMINKVFEANLVGLILMCTKAIQYMKFDDCYIINVMSTAALRGKSNETVYCAAKWGARGYTEALKEAVKNTNIHVFGVYPGGMKTDFWNYNDKSKLSKYMNPQYVAEEIFKKVFILKSDIDNIIIERKESI